MYDYIICKTDGKNVLCVDYDQDCNNPRTGYDHTWNLVFEDYGYSNLPQERHESMSKKELMNSRNYMVVPVIHTDFYQHEFKISAGIASEYDWSRANGYAWIECDKVYSDDVLLKELSRELDEYMNWANSNCYEVFLYDMNGNMQECMDGFICDDAEECYEIQKDYAVDFDFDKARDARKVVSFRFE